MAYVTSSEKIRVLTYHWSINLPLTSVLGFEKIGTVAEW